MLRPRHRSRSIINPSSRQAAGLYSWFPLNESQGAAFDRARSILPGIPSSTGITKSSQGIARKFSGSPSKIDIGDRGYLDVGTGNFAISARILCSATNTRQTIIGQDSNQTGARQVYFTVHSDYLGNNNPGKISCAVFATNTAYYSTESVGGPVSANNEYNVIYYRNNTTHGIYLNGDNLAVANNITNGGAGLSVQNSARSMYIGAREYSGFTDNFNGYICDVRFYRGITMTPALAKEISDSPELLWTPQRSKIFLFAPAAAGNGDAPGALWAGTGMFLGGAPTGDGVAIGSLIIGTGSILPGAATGDGVAAGALIVGTGSVLPGAATGDAQAPGATITGTGTFIGGQASGTGDGVAPGALITGTGAFLGGQATGSGVASGALWTGTGTFLGGQASGTGAGTAPGALWVGNGSLLGGQAIGDGVAIGSLIVGTGAFSGGQATGDGVAPGASWPGIGSLLGAQASGGATAGGALWTGTGTFLGGQATGDTSGANAPGALITGQISFIGGAPSVTGGQTNSSRPGYLRPNTGPDDCQILEDQLQAMVSGVTGLPGEMVRPRWQSEPPNRLSNTTTWAAIGIIRREHLEYPILQDDKYYNQEELSILVSFYGPCYQELAAIFRDGIHIPQNMSIKLVAVGNIHSVPELINQKWYLRADVEFIVRRTISRQYNILSLVDFDARYTHD